MSTNIVEKPPRHGHSKSHPAHTSSPSRTRKVNRQAPVPKRRQSSPGRLKRDRASVRIDSSDSETENDVSDNRVNGIENNNRPSTLPLRSRSIINEEKEPTKKSQHSYSSTNKNMDRNRSIDQSCYCPRGKCVCRVRRNTKVLTPGISPAEVMEKETKLIVLEYLSSLSIDELTARNKTSRQESFASTSQEDFTRGRKSVKANTVTLGENERKEILAMLAKQNAEEQLKNGKKLGRSASDVSDQQHEKMRRKFREMQVPIKKWMDANLRQEITLFDKSNLKTSPRTLNRQVSKRSKVSHATMSPLRIKMPRGSLVNPPSESPIPQPDPLMTPHTFVANGLEAIGEEIMIDYPDLLNKPITDLLVPLSENKNISYDVFKSVAKSVFDVELARVTPTVWSRIALTLYMVKETMFLGNLNDTQLELMVDYSTKFLTVNASEQVEEEGGWDSLEAETEEFFWAGAYDAISSDEENEAKIERKISRQHIYQNASLREKVSQTVAEWSPIGMAAMLVALGIGYSYLRT